MASSSRTAPCSPVRLGPLLLCRIEQDPGSSHTRLGLAQGGAGSDCAPPRRPVEKARPRPIRSTRPCAAGNRDGQLHNCRRERAAHGGWCCPPGQVNGAARGVESPGALAPQDAGVRLSRAAANRIARPSRHPLQLAPGTLREGLLHVLSAINSSAARRLTRQARRSSGHIVSTWPAVPPLPELAERQGLSASYE